MMQTTATKSRGIIFSAEMVRALLREETPKTQTRRVVKPQPVHTHEQCHNVLRVNGKCIGVYPFGSNPRYHHIFGCPYGKVGDQLWVRETWCPRSGGMLAMDRVCIPRYRASDELRPEWGFRWRSSIHMPRWASRITLEITDIRVQRLHDISNDDINAEGFPVCTDAPPHEAFANKWVEINGKGSWQNNPWVWAISFRKVAQ